MRPFLLSTFLLASILSVHGQIEIEGPRVLHCPPVEANYYAYSLNGQSVVAQWTLIPTTGAQVIQTSENFATILFWLPGTYTIIVQVYQDNGEVYEETLIVDVIGIDPSETFWVEGCQVQNPDTTGCRKVCAHSTSTVYMTVGQFPGEWIISGADSYTVLGQEAVEITWGAGGTGTVSVETQCGQPQICFEILPLPIAGFTTSPAAQVDTLTVCRGQEVFFASTAENALTTTWSFGDGTESSEQDVYHQFATEGMYTVTQTVETICDCADESELVVKVLPSAAPELDCVNSICRGGRQRYTAMTDGCTGFSWSVSGNGTVVDGGDNDDDFVEVIWGSGPDGYVNLTVSGCNTQYCGSSSTFRIPVISPDGPISGDQSVCASELVAYQVPYFPGAEYNWNVGSAGEIITGHGSNSIVVQWDDVNTVTNSNISVSYDNCFLDCGGQATLPVQITPLMRIAGDYQVCFGGTANATAEAGFGMAVPASVEWQIEDEAGNVIFTGPGPATDLAHVFAYPPGSYYWVAINNGSAYCNPDARQRITVTPEPQVPLAILGVDKICPGIPYGFTVDPSGTYASHWTVVDGMNTHTYTGASITHTFGNAPPFFVEVVHADVQFPDCKSTAILKELTASSFDEIDGSGDVCFNTVSTYTVVKVTGSDYSWTVMPEEMGEIRKVDDHAIEVFWTSAGVATLRLEVCSAALEKEVTVHPLPEFEVNGIQAVCKGARLWIHTDQSGLDHTWYDESGAIIGSEDSVHIGAGAYAVGIADENGCIAKLPFEIPVLPAPEVQVTSPVHTVYCGTIPSGVPLVANTDGETYIFNWYVDGVDINHHDPVLVATDFGTYQVYATNTYGCAAYSQTVQIENCCPPNSCGGGGGGPPVGCTYLEEDLGVQISTSECPGKEYTASPDLLPGFEWGVTSLAMAPATYATETLSLTYALPGYYHIIVYGQLDGVSYADPVCGHFQIFTDTVRAVADFAYGRACAGEAAHFEDLTTFLPDETIDTWDWNFGDPASGADNNSSVPNPVHEFSAPGTYTVTLNVTLASGCSTSREYPVIVSAGPDLSPVFDTVSCEREATAFDINGEVFDVQWDFGDPASGLKDSASSATALHAYANPGIYDVTVIGADHLGCVSSKQISVDVRPNTLSGIIAVDPGPSVCQGESVSLTAPAGGLSWIWSNEATTESINVSESGQFAVFMVDQFNCTYTAPAEYIEVLPVPSLVVKAREVYGPDEYGPWEDALSICYGTPYQVWAFATGNVDYQWDDGSANQFISFTLESGTYPGPGMHTVELQVTDLDNDCLSDTSDITVEIHALPVKPQIALTGGTGCSFNDNVLEIANPQSGLTYVWSDGQTGTSIIAATTGSFSVEAITAGGCKTESDMQVIKPSAPVDRLPGGCYIACDPLEVCLPGMSSVTSYTIFKNGMSFLSGASWPGTFMIDEDGTYTIEVTTANGCTATSDPLDVTLYQGVGVVTVYTYEDLDGDGVIGPGDALVSGIPVQIKTAGSVLFGKAVTDNGVFDFSDTPADGYVVSVDRDQLSPQWQVILDSLGVAIATCDDTVIVELLLTRNCEVPGAQLNFEICPGEFVEVGDSVWTDTGAYEAHFMSQGGCDSVVHVRIDPRDSMTIAGSVWFDVDKNGMVSAGDTLVPGIAVVLEDLISGEQNVYVTGSSGIVSIDILTGGYLFTVDTVALPDDYIVLAGLDSVSVDDCGTVFIDLLLGEKCTPTTIIEFATLCPGDSLLINGQWENNPGIYTYTSSAPDADCDTVTDVHLSFYAGLQVSGQVDVDCDGVWGVGTISLDIAGEGPFDVTWSDSLAGDTLITGLPTGTYTVTVQDTNGCSTTSQFVVDSVLALSFDSLPPVFTIVLGDTLEINVTGDTQVPGTTIQWDQPGILSCDQCFSTQANPVEPTLLRATVTDINGCTYALSTLLDVVEDTTSVYVPNVFSPNSDGQNDYFTVYSNDQEAHVLEFAIFDRWGNVVYRVDDLPLDGHRGWDGKFQGKSMANQVCVYYVKLRMSDGSVEMLSGDVLVLR